MVGFLDCSQGWLVRLMQCGEKGEQTDGAEGGVGEFNPLS